MTNYQQFQLDNYGDILPEYDNPLIKVEEIENGEREREDWERWLELQEEIWLNEQNK